MPRLWKLFRGNLTRRFLRVGRGFRFGDGSGGRRGRRVRCWWWCAGRRWRPDRLDHVVGLRFVRGLGLVGFGG
ncbi:hypothetical protein A5708_20325 [Mycobacterium colombiense]|uniref:Uncharacterized protein n=1 Tax=Mycobacterium colombiense TaxID=339268 RepID=A0A1A2YZE7_9MYCO|nr:hypothetical protein A5708_20325 [Mycobacterium colombiense]